MTLTLAALFYILPSTMAQDAVNDAPVKPKKITLSSGVEGSLLQFAPFLSTVSPARTIPRYSYFFNTGIDVNYHLSNNLRPFTGLQLKNIGLIYKSNDSIRSKHRVYTLGAPLGIKYYSNNRKLMLKTGVDVALALNYKWKTFVRDTKTKNHEYFSDLTSPIFASAFAGLSFYGLSLTGNFYFTDFFNPSQPGNAAIDSRLVTLGIGLNLDDQTLKKKK